MSKSVKQLELPVAVGSSRTKGSLEGPGIGICLDPRCCEKQRVRMNRRSRDYLAALFPGTGRGSSHEAKKDRREWTEKERGWSKLNDDGRWVIKRERNVDRNERVG